MAIGKYRALKEFDHDNRLYGLGQELVLSDSEAKKYLEKGQIDLIKYLDEENPVDIVEAEETKASPDGSVPEDEKGPSKYNKAQFGSAQKIENNRPSEQRKRRVEKAQNNFSGKREKATTKVS